MNAGEIEKEKQLQRRAEFMKDLQWAAGRLENQVLIALDNIKQKNNKNPFLIKK